MKTLIQSVLVLVFLLAADLYPQQQILSAGKAPINKTRSHNNYGKFPLADIAYANDNSTSNNISIDMPEGHPFTILGSFTAPNFAASMCKGGDGNFYLIDVAPALYLFDPGSGTCTLIGNITGMGGDQPNGIAFNSTNSTYYMCSSASLYTLDINTLTATFVGSFTPAITGLMIDLCFDETGTCYSYDVDINPGAANGYIIDINTAAITALGYVGFTPNYGQGMSYDYETQTIYLSAFNSDTFSGQLRTMDKNTGMTTLVYDWVDQIAPFAVESEPCCCHPYPGSASNPNPPPGTTDISINGITLSWDNGVYATMVEVWLGPPENEVKVYDGPLITSWDTGPLEYYTVYHWRIVEKNDTCSNSGSNWSFTTIQNPNLLILNFYPQTAQFWTGSSEATTKTDGEINTIYPNVGWAAFDISTILPGSTIQDVTFSGYVNSNNWPYWSATPMGSVNPVTADAATINSQILASYDEGVAYIFRNESGSLATGWYTYPLGNNALSDLQAIVNSGQGYFAMGFVDRDLTASFFINFDGWSQPNPPYIGITYGPIPVELTSFRADVVERKVVLNWSTATETNNRGFEIQRSEIRGQRSEIGGQRSDVRWENIGFVEGNGTSTSVHSYSYTDNKVSDGKYIYRLKQIDFDGSFEYSKEVEVNVNLPLNFSLSQNYPNPLNPTTKIKFSIPEDRNVNIIVYNSLGQQIDQIINGIIKAGSYEVSFNASQLPSGIYFYQMKSGSFIQTKKMILLK